MQPFPQGGQGQMGGRYMNAMNIGGYGGHQFARPPASAFRRQYRAYSTAILEIQQGRGYGTGGRANVMYGGKSEHLNRGISASLIADRTLCTVIMPPSALDELSALRSRFE